MTKAEKDLLLAKHIGRQMDGQILCPAGCIYGQHLSTYGDFEDTLFCPHCDIDVKIEIVFSSKEDD